MVLLVTKYDIHPDKTDAYLKWAEAAMKSMVPGVAETRAYRAITGSSQCVVTYEFADMEACAAWLSNEEVQKRRAELGTVAFNVQAEIWGPSPVMPAPIR